MSQYKEIMKEMKKRGLIRPKRQGKYVPRIQLVAKVEEQIQIQVIIRAYEHDISVGELLENLVLEMLESKRLFKKCVSKKRTRDKYGQHLNREVYAQPGNQHASKDYTPKEIALIEEIIHSPLKEPEPESKRGKQLAKLRQLGRDRRRKK